MAAGCNTTSHPQLPQLASSRTDPANSGCSSSDPARQLQRALRAGTAGAASRPIVVLDPRRTRPETRTGRGGASAVGVLELQRSADGGCTPAGCLVTGTCSHIHRENKASSVEPAASAYRHPAACFCHLAMSGCICARAVAGFPAMPAQDCFQLQMGAEEPGNRDYGANFCIFPLILASSPHHTSSEETPWKQAANAMCVMSQ